MKLSRGNGGPFLYTCFLKLKIETLATTPKQAATKKKWVDKRPTVQRCFCPSFLLEESSGLDNLFQSFLQSSHIKPRRVLWVFSPLASLFPLCFNCTLRKSASEKVVEKNPSTTGSKILRLAPLPTFDVVFLLESSKRSDWRISSIESWLFLYWMMIWNHPTII